MSSLASHFLAAPEAEGDPRLRASRCRGCGTVVFPRMAACPSCLAMGRMDEVGIGRVGKLYSHTIAHFAPLGFKAPFFQAFVDLPEGPRVFSLIGRACPVRHGMLADGMEMRLIVEALAETSENRDVLTYKYVPATLERLHA